MNQKDYTTGEHQYHTKLKIFFIDHHHLSLPPKQLLQNCKQIKPKKKKTVLIFADNNKSNRPELVKHNCELPFINSN